MNTKHAEIETFKSDIKLITDYTKEYKKVFKDAQRNSPSYPYRSNSLKEFVKKWEESKKIPEVVSIWDHKYRRRHLHVAYALLKGRSLNQIEQKSKEELNIELVKMYITKYTGSQELADSLDVATGTINRDLMYELEAV